MSRFILSLGVLAVLGVLGVPSVPGDARADIVMAIPHECPPGLDLGHSHRGSFCTPRACEPEGACPDGSACRSIDWCRREEMDDGGGHMSPRMVTVTLGRCDASGGCPAAEPGAAPWSCVTAHRCEPTEPTPAWDASARRWTERPHPASGRGARPQVEPSAPGTPSTDEPAAPEEGETVGDDTRSAPAGARHVDDHDDRSSAGCRVTPGSAPLAWVIVVGLLVGLVRARRSA